MDSEKDKKVKRIARFLELGGTMLAEHCKVCGAPKFRYQGTVICPVCDVQEEGETPEPDVQVPETRQREEEKSSEIRGQIGAQEGEKEAQERLKPFSNLRTSETVKEMGNNLFFQNEISEAPYKTEKSRNYTATIQDASPTKMEQKEGALKSYGAHGDRKELENLLFRKIVNIAGSLQDETDPRSIAEGFELIEKGLELIERLRSV